MKILITALCFCCTVYANNSFAFAIIRPVVASNASISFSIMKASEFVNLSARDYSAITGKRLNLWNRISFSFSKIKIKHALKKNPQLSISEYYSKHSKHMSPLLWIGLGLVAVVIILLLAGLTVYG